MYTTPQVLAALLPDDDEEDAAPLCIFVELLREKFVRARELGSEKIVQRALAEMESPEVCACPYDRRGLKGLVIELLREGGKGAEEVLESFVQVFFRDKGRKVSSLGRRFRLAELVVRVMRDKWPNKGDARYEAWLRRAMLPPRAGVADRDENDLLVRFCSFPFWLSV